MDPRRPPPHMPITRSTPGPYQRPEGSRVGRMEEEMRRAFPGFFNRGGRIAPPVLPNPQPEGPRSPPPPQEPPASNMDSTSCVCCPDRALARPGEPPAPNMDSTSCVCCPHLALARPLLPDAPPASDIDACQDVASAHCVCCPRPAQLEERPASNIESTHCLCCQPDNPCPSTSNATHSVCPLPVPPRSPLLDDPRPSTSADTQVGEAWIVWEAEPDPRKAYQRFRRELLFRNENARIMTLRIDLGEDPDEQENAIINFYKQGGRCWTAPIRFMLLGDVAVGLGVTRFVFSMVMEKVNNGFQLSQGSTAVTRLFDGEADHRIPSASSILADSELWTMAGRMIGHSFLHGGPTVRGLSPAFVHLLTGGSETTTVAMLTLQDVPDLDHRETIQLLSGEEGLSEDQRTRVLNLCLAWDFEAPTANNRLWLFQNLLMYAVITRVKPQILKLRIGLKESGIWPLISCRKDVVGILFPRESEPILTAQNVLQCISWPNIEDDDPDSYRVLGYLRAFILQASPEDLRNLLKFWIGWEAPSVMRVVVTTAALPTASTCFETLRLPGHYRCFQRFKEHMMMCLNSVDSGFGLV